MLEYFNLAAGRYAQDIEPALESLAQRLIALADLKPHERVIDLGTGTGLAARLALQSTSRVVGLDFAYEMLISARRQGARALIRGDMHHLGVRAGIFDVALASFAFNSTDPRISFAEANRILSPGGRLVLQEWGSTDALSNLVSETIVEYMVDDPPPDLARLRAEISASTPWDDLESADGIVACLAEARFGPIQSFTDVDSVPFQSVDDFLRYKLAWPSRRAEILAMPAEVRRLCLADLRENLIAVADGSGKLVWSPEVIRIVAQCA